MGGGPTLRRPGRKGGLISLVPMIDVMLILLVFFMVTSTYLNLDMIPAAQRGEEAAAQGSGPGAGSGATLMIRLGADDRPVLRGRALSPDELKARLREAVAAEPLTQVLILPSPAARTQSLISIMEAATLAGVERLRVVRLEARP